MRKRNFAVWFLCLGMCLVYGCSGGVSGDSTQDIYVSLILVDNATGQYSTNISSAAPGRLIATIKDISGNPLPSRVVAFDATIGDIQPESKTALTNLNGQATVFLLAGTKAGAGQATAKISGKTAVVTFATQGDTNGTQLEFVLVSLSLVNDSTQAATTEVSAAAPGRLVAKLTDSLGAPIANQVMTFTTTIGKLQPEAGTDLTDENGLAQVLLLAGTKAGAGEAKAEFKGTSATVGFITAGDEQGDVPENYLLTIQLLSNTTGGITNTISAADPGRLVATLTDSTGTPIVNELLQFSTTLGSLNPTTGTALTGIDGQAAVLLYPGSVAGAGAAKVAFGDYKAEVNFWTTGDAGHTVSLVILNDATGTATNTITSSAAARLVATVKDSSGNPVKQQIVYFSTTLGSLLPSDGVAYTNDEGKATAYLLAGSTLGSGQVSARYSSFTSTADFTIVSD